MAHSANAFRTHYPARAVLLVLGTVLLLAFNVVVGFLFMALVPPLIPVYASVLFVQEWPLSANGKLDLAALPRPDQRAGLRAARVRPENALELTLLEIWAQVLGCAPDALGTTDNFFERGGNSLRLVKVAAQISERTGLECRIADLFQQATIQGMARALAEPAPAPSAPAPSTVQQRARERAAKRASLRS